MNHLIKVGFLFVVAIAAAVRADPYLTMTSGLTLDRGFLGFGNLIVNGSFESGGPGNFWATGTAYTAYSPLPGWVSAGGPYNYAQWGRHR